MSLESSLLLTNVKLCDDTPMSPPLRSLYYSETPLGIKWEKAATWLFKLSKGEVPRPEHTNVIGTRPGIPNPDTQPRIQRFVASLHGPLLAGTVSKAAQCA